MLSSSIYAMIKLSKTSSPQKLFVYDCVTLYLINNENNWNELLFRMHFCLRSQLSWKFLNSCNWACKDWTYPLCLEHTPGTGEELCHLNTHLLDSEGQTQKCQGLFVSCSQERIWIKQNSKKKYRGSIWGRCYNVDSECEEWRSHCYDGWGRYTYPTPKPLKKFLKC